MRHDAESHALRAAALAAAAMYLLDPDNGKRRRAIACDKAVSVVQHAAEVVVAAGRDIANRVRGARATVRSRLRREAARDDLQLIERVRARIGRVVSHPHAIQVGAREGIVTLSGPVLAHEVPALVRAAASVPGVAGVDDHLAVYREAGSVPSLQGDGRRRSGTSPLQQRLRTPEVRAAAVLGGSALLLAGLARRSPAGVVLAAIGAALAVQGSGARLLPNPPSASEAPAAGEQATSSASPDRVEDQPA